MIVVLAMVFGSLILISLDSDIAAIFGGDPSAILEELFSSVTNFLSGDSVGELGTKVISLDSKGLMVTVKVGISKAGS